MATDRDAKLTIKTQLDGMDKAAEQTAAFVEQVTVAGEVGKESAVELQQVADATEQITSAQTQLTQTAGEATAAIETVGNVAAEAAQKTEDGAQATEEAMRGVADAAQAENAAIRETGDGAQQAARSTSEAYEAVRLAAEEAIRLWRESTTAASESGDAGATSAREVVESFQAQAAAIKSSDSALEVQRVELMTIVSTLQEMVNGYVAAGSAGKEQGDLTGVALIGMKAQLADVNAAIKAEVTELRQVEEQGRSSYENLRGATLTVQEATEIAASKIRAAWQIYNEELKITPRSVGFVVQAVDGLRQAIDETRGTTNEATTAEVADYEKLRVELGKLQAQARIVLDEQNDARLLLKEGGNQIQSVGIAVQQLTSNLGPMGAAIGSVAGSAALMSGGLQQVRDAFKQMNLNTLQFGEVSAASVVQMAAVVAALAAGVAVGTKFAETSNDNAESLDHVKESASGLGDRVKNVIGGVQEEIDKSSGSILTILANLTSSTGEAGVAFAEMADNVAGITVAEATGAAGARIYYEALRNGIDAADAERIAVSLSAGQIKIHTEAQAKGVIGQALWDQAMKESGGDATVFAGKMSELKVRLDLLSDSLDHVQKATNGHTVEIRDQINAMQQYIPESDRYSVILKQQADNLQKDLDNTIGLTRVERERVQAIIDLAQRGENLNQKQKDLLASLIAATAAGKAASDQTKGLVADLQREADATIGTSAALSRRLAAINALLPASQKHALELRAIAAELQDELNKTDGLSAKERERIQVIIELIAKGETLTASEKVLIQFLVQHALAHDKVALAARAQADAESALVGAVDQLSAAIKEETGAHGDNQTAIGKAVEAASALLKSNTTLTSAEQDRIRKLIELGKAIDEDNIRLKAMSDSSTRVAGAASAQAAATENVYSVVRASAKTLQEDIEAKKQLYDLLQKLSVTQDESARSTKALTVTIEDGHKVISNESDEVLKLTGVLKDGDAQISNNRDSQVTFTGVLRDGTAAIVSQGESVRSSTKAVADNATAITEAVNGAADAMKGHADKARAAADLLFAGYEQANVGANTLKTTILGMDADFVTTTGHVNDLVESLKRLRDQAAETSGSAPQGVGQTIPDSR